MLETGVSHAERREDPLPREFIERASRHTVDDDRQQDVSGIAVQMFVSRLEIEPHLPRERIQHAALCNHLIGWISRKSRQCQIVTQTACVMEQLSDRDAGRMVGQFRQVGPNAVLELQLPSRSRSRIDRA